MRNEGTEKLSKCKISPTLTFFFRQWFWGVAPARLSEIALATAPKRASAKLQIFTLVQVWKWSAQAKSFTEKDPPGYIITQKNLFVKKNFKII